VRGRVTLVGLSADIKTCVERARHARRRVAATKSRLAQFVLAAFQAFLQFVSVGFLGGEQLAQVEGGGEQCRFSSLSAASLRCQRNREGTSFNRVRKTRSDGGRLSTVRMTWIVDPSLVTRREPSALVPCLVLPSAAGRCWGRWLVR